MHVHDIHTHGHFGRDGPLLVLQGNMGYTRVAVRDAVTEADGLVDACGQIREFFEDEPVCVAWCRRGEWEGVGELSTQGVQDGGVGDDVVGCDEERLSCDFEAGADDGLGFIAHPLEGFFLGRKGGLKDFVEDSRVVGLGSFLAVLHFEDFLFEVLGLG
jgi:hypothetical protein